MINVNSRTAKLRIATANTRLMLRHEVKFSRELSKVFGKQFEAVAKSIADYDRHYAKVIDAYNSELRTIYNYNIRQIMHTFGIRALESINKEQKSPYTEYLVEIEKYIATYVAAKVQQVSNGTKNIIARIIAKGQDSNATNYEIAKQISKIGEISKLTRAKNIARTETHSAAMHSFQTSMNQSGMIREKEWVTFEDSRTRTEPFNHVVADGERVNIKEPFRRTGEHLMYPGDPNGSAGNIINCRCNPIFFTNTLTNILVEPKPSDNIMPVNNVISNPSSNLDKNPYKGNSESFDEYSERMDYIEKDFIDEKWEKNLTDEEKEAIKKYTSKEYSSINVYLRDNGFSPVSEWDKETREILKHKVDTISNAINRTELKEETISFRYVDNRLAEKIENMGKGGIFRDEGFTSTSIGADIFIPEYQDEELILMEIILPKGTKAAYVKNLSAHRAEREILLNKSNNYIYNGYRERTVRGQKEKVLLLRLDNNIHKNINISKELKPIKITSKFIWDISDIILLINEV